MKRMTYLMMLIFTAFYFTACENDSDSSGAPSAGKGDMTGDWKYSQPYFEFEYATDTIHFGNFAIAEKEIKQLFLEMATQKMGDYFTGIEFVSPQQLVVKARYASDKPLNIHAEYIKNEMLMEVSLDKEDMASFMGDKAAMIPAISFNYLQSEKELTIYFDKIYVRTLWETAQLKKMLSELLATKMIPGFQEMPQTEQQQALLGIQRQVSAVLNNIRTLKIGFVLTKIIHPQAPSLL